MEWVNGIPMGIFRLHMYVIIFLVKVTEWPHIEKIAAHSAYYMFSWYKYLIVNLVFSNLRFWSGKLFSDCAFS